MLPDLLPPKKPDLISRQMRGYGTDTKKWKDFHINLEAKFFKRKFTLIPFLFSKEIVQIHIYINSAGRKRRSEENAAKLTNSFFSWSDASH